MLDEFRLTIKEHWDKLKNEPVQAALTRSEVEDETLTPPLYKAGLELETEDLLGTFTVWGTGDLSVIIMNRHTGEEIVVDDRHLTTPKDMGPVLLHYFQLIEQGGQLSKCP